MPSQAHEDIARLIEDNPTPLETPIEDRRDGFDRLLLSFPLDDDVTATTVDAGGVPVSWVETSDSRPERVVFQIHGGGVSMGTATTYREFASRLARGLRARVAVVDYRLAPEAPYPAPLDDCVTAYRWLLDQGIAAEQIVVVGDSGGVGLALSTIARARDEQLPTPGAFVGFAPWIDFAVGSSIAEAADVGDAMSSREAQQRFADWYLNGHPATDPVVNVLHADLRGMPPTLLLAATRDVVYRDALRYAELARPVGVPVTVRTFHGLIHNWQMFPHLPEAADAVAAAAEFVAAHLPTAAHTKEPV